MAEKYYLMPGCSISKKGLPKGGLSCKEGSKPAEIKEVHLKAIEKNIPFLKTQGKIKTMLEIEDMKEKAEAAASDTGKSDKRTKLEEEAKELGVPFNTKTSNKDLAGMIDEKNLENETDPETGTEADPKPGEGAE